MLQDAGTNDSSSTIKKRFPDQNFRGASQQVVNCSLKYRNTRLKYTHPTKHTGRRVAETKWWNKNKLLSKYWREEKLCWKNTAHEITQHLICQTWQCFCYSLGMYGCQWNWHTAIYWWFHCWQKKQDECRGVQEHSVCSHSDKCIKNHWVTKPKKYSQNNLRAFRGQTNWSPGLSRSEHLLNSGLFAAWKRR